MFMTDRLLEIYQRSRKGKFMKEVEYDLMLAKRTQELLKEFDIKYDPKMCVQPTMTWLTVSSRPDYSSWLM